MDIKITTGFNADEKFIIDSEEAHKAYYLFNNPELRGTFKNGVAIVGRDIRSIQPAWNESMGWNPSHKLDDDDWNDIRSKGVDTKINKLLLKASDVARLAEKNLSLLEEPLTEIQISLPTAQHNQIGEEMRSLADKFKM